MRRASIFALGLILLCPATAAANGRFPGAAQLVMRGDSGAMTTSFGVVLTADKFTTPRWACETALGYDPLAVNELAAGVFASGAIAIAGPSGVTISTDHGCTNIKPPGFDNVWMSDISVDEKTPTTALGLVRGPKTGDCAGAILETIDEGKTWSTLVAHLPTDFCPLTLDTSPADPQRLYVSGNSVGPDGKKLIAQLLVSDDRGAHWQTYEIPNEQRPFIGAMHPKNKDTLYVRTLNPPGSGNLLVTKDGGKTFKQIATLTGVLLNFFGVTGLSLSPDGSKLAYGSVYEGLFVLEADPDAAVPEKRADWPVMCLRWTDDGLYACSAPNLCGPFFVGKSLDEGRNFTTVLKTLGDVDGDHTTCAGDTPVAKDCPSYWETLKPRFGVCGGKDAGPAADDGGVVADAGPTKPPPPPSIGSCICDTTQLAGRSWMVGGAGAAVAAAVAMLRRFKRRK